jgi:hypothetical protein
MAILIHWVRGWIAREAKGQTPWLSAVLMIRFTVWVIVLLILQILLWAGFYRWQCFPSWESCFYVSASAFSTVGYGDVVLPSAWRAVGPIESVVGVVMCGMSVSALFAILTRLLAAEDELLKRQ